MADIPFFNTSSVKQAKRPPIPRPAGTAEYEERTRQLMQDPLSSMEFQNFLRAQRDRSAYAKNAIGESITGQYAQPGSPGLRSGAAMRAGADATAQYNAQESQQTAQFLSNLMQLGPQSWMQYYNTLVDYQARSYGAQQAGRRVLHQEGAVNQIVGMTSQLAGAGAFSGLGGGGAAGNLAGG